MGSRLSVLVVGVLERIHVLCKRKQLWWVENLASSRQIALSITRIQGLTLGLCYPHPTTSRNSRNQALRSPCCGSNAGDFPASDSGSCCTSTGIPDNKARLHEILDSTVSTVHRDSMSCVDQVREFLSNAFPPSAPCLKKPLYSFWPSWITHEEPHIRD